MSKLKLINILNFILLALIIAGDVLYIIFDSIYLKGITSALFVITGLINVIFVIRNTNEDKRFPIAMLVGLFFAFLGDIVLELHFITGAILFAVGHIFFFISYSFIEKFSFKDLISGAIIFVPSMLIIVLLPCFNFNGIVMEIVAVVYALIISIMVGKAVTNLIRNRSLKNLLIVIGSTLFFFSDLMLLFNVFSTIDSAVFGILCLATYYPAEFILAYSILYKNEKQKGVTND